MVDQIFVHGESLQNYLVAVVTLNLEMVKDWAEKNHISFDKVYDSQQLESYLKQEFDYLAE